jgi:polyisoprenoid-binding protein YceI
MARVLKILVGLLVLALLALGAFLVWYFVIDDDAPPEAELRERPASEQTTTPGSGGAGASADGTWTVQAGPEVFVGYRVQELFAGDTLKKDAVGRTPVVTGTITVTGSTVESGSFTADLTRLASDQSRRDDAIRTRGLETNEFPEATFTITEPIDLGEQPVVGKQYTVTARGDLTLHGVTRPVDVEVDARWNGDSIDVAGRAPIVLADYAIEPPDVLGRLEVDDDGVMEFQLTFARGA